MFTPDTPDPIRTAIVEVIDVGMQKANDSQPKRQYLGASAIGKACQRELAYSYHMVQKDEGTEFKGRTLRMFDMGHDGETRMAAYIRQGGFTLETHLPDGKQIGIADADNKFKGHLDGIITAGPKIKGLKYPLLWENKALGSKTYSKMESKGLKEASPTYYGQVQIYMGYKELPKCMFTAINRDTGEIYVEMVEFNAVDCQALIDKALRIVQSSNPEELGKAGRGADDFVCKFCDYRKRCHGVPVVEQVNPETFGWL